MLIISSSIITIGTITTILLIQIKKDKNNNENGDKPNLYKVTINGAIYNPGEYEFHKPLTIREIIFKANVRTNADINSLQLDQIINRDCEINVPFKIDTFNKLKWSEITNLEQLINLGITKSIATKLLNHRRQYIKTTWDEIYLIKGIGKTTLNHLKELIDLL